MAKAGTGYVRVRQESMIRLSKLYGKARRMHDEPADTMLRALGIGSPAWTQEEYQVFAMHLITQDLCAHLVAYIDMEMDGPGAKWSSPVFLDTDKDELALSSEEGGVDYDWSALDQGRG